MTESLQTSSDTLPPQTPEKMLERAVTWADFEAAFLAKMRSLPADCTLFITLVENTHHLVKVPGGSIEKLGKLWADLIDIHKPHCPNPASFDAFKPHEKTLNY